MTYQQQQGLHPYVYPLNIVDQYDLTTPYDVSTKSFEKQTKFQ